MSYKIFAVLIIILAALLTGGCGDKKSNGPNISEDAASKVYVPAGKYDEFYSFVSGGFSGQLAVYGLPSGRLFRVNPCIFQLTLKRMGLH
jgi:nitrous-oxide reductase